MVPQFHESGQSLQSVTERSPNLNAFGELCAANGFCSRVGDFASIENLS